MDPALLLTVLSENTFEINSDLTSSMHLMLYFIADPKLTRNGSKISSFDISLRKWREKKIVKNKKGLILQGKSPPPQASPL